MPTNTKNSLKIIVDGQVQRVGYRQHIKKSADALSVLGYVKNQMGGRVEIIATGTALQLDEFMLQVKRGSINSQVAHIDWIACELIEFDDFQIV